MPRGEKPGTPAARPARIHLTVKPKRVKEGHRVTLLFTATAQVTGKTFPVTGATVTLDGKKVKTAAKGQARMSFRSSRKGAHQATARRPDLRPGAASVRIIDGDTD